MNTIGLAFESSVEHVFAWFSATTLRKYLGLIIGALLLASLPACSAEHSTAPVVVETVPQEKILVVSTDYAVPEYGPALVVASQKDFKVSPGSGNYVQQDIPAYISMIGDQKVVIANTIRFGLAGDSVQLKGSFKNGSGSTINGVATMYEQVWIGEKEARFLRDTSRFVGSVPAMFPLISASMRNAGAYSMVSFGVGFETACQNMIVDASQIELLLFSSSYNSSWNIRGARLIKLECYVKNQAPASVLAGYERQRSGR